MTDDLDYAKLDPGIREAVRWLRELGFNTTDSGDGRSKPEEARSIEGPHVVIVYEGPDFLEIVAEDLLGLLADRFGEVPGDVEIQANFNPRDGVCMILVLGDGLLDWHRVTTEEAGV